MKKLWVLLCCGILLVSMGIPAFAEEMVLTLTVPEQHTGSIESPGGRIVADGAVCGAQVEIQRHKQQAYWILPDPGKELDALFYNGADVTDQVQNGVFAAGELLRDAELKAVFADAAPAPDDRLYTVSGRVVDAKGDPVPDGMLEIGGKSGSCDENGGFSVKDLSSGGHTVVIYDASGKIMGHGRILIDKADATDLILTLNEAGEPVVKPRDDTQDISLALSIGQDGVVAVEGAKDITVHPSGDPSTGDSSNLAFYLVLLAASGAALIALSVFLAKRKEK